MDVGCGSCDFMLDFRDRLHAESVTFLDYDPKVIEKLRPRYTGPGVYFQVADILQAGLNGRFDLVFFLDMLHEVYSFHGRPNRNLAEPVDHERGLAAVRTAVTNVAATLNPGGGIVITDNVLCEEDHPVTVKILAPRPRDAVRHFLADFPTKVIPHRFLDDWTLTLDSRDFCILLTQYNKIKNGDIDRWNVERLEIHQYWTLEQFRTMFRDLGCRICYEIGTPSPSYSEWMADFQVLEGMPNIPHKRITLLAIKERD